MFEFCKKQKNSKHKISGNSEIDIRKENNKKKNGGKEKKRKVKDEE